MSYFGEIIALSLEYPCIVIYDVKYVIMYLFSVFIFLLIFSLTLFFVFLDLS